MDIVRGFYILKYCWRHSLIVAQDKVETGNRIHVFFDMVACYMKYKLLSNQYLKEKFWELSAQERKEVGERYHTSNRKIETWNKDWYANNQFLSKYSNPSYDNSLFRRKKRLNAYSKRYNFGEGLYIESGVNISRQHYSFSNISAGCKLHIGRNADIDYTGGITIGDNVSILEGVKILTHNHDFFGAFDDKEYIQGSNQAIKTPLVIEDNVIICARCFIMPGVDVIGKNSVISAGSFVTKKVPANSLVSGNPAKIIARIPEGSRIS